MITGPYCGPYVKMRLVRFGLRRRPLARKHRGRSRGDSTPATTQSPPVMVRSGKPVADYGLGAHQEVG